MNIKNLGQVFTPDFIVRKMISLQKNFDGKVLEPSCGNGAFLKFLSKNTVSIEYDNKIINNEFNTLNLDFFNYEINNKFDTIMGNPPYVRYQDILTNTKLLLRQYIDLFDKRSNLYLFFIYKSILHLNAHGEIIFITPRDFLKSTSSQKLNKYLYDNGTITDFFDLGDSKVFGSYTPNCAIWRFEKDNFFRKTNQNKNFYYREGKLYFTENNYKSSYKLGDFFLVKVGAVSGANNIFYNEKYGNQDFVCSTTYKDFLTKKVIYNKHIPYLDRFKSKLISRKIKKFDENNWYMWGRDYYKTNKLRIYVNIKTRNKTPFFIHPCKAYDGSVLAIIPKFDCNMESLYKVLDMFNNINWKDLGFICDGRYIFSQRGLENSPLSIEDIKFLSSIS